MKKKLINTFLDLVRFDTASNPKSNTFPSTENLLDFAEYLAAKLSAIGLADVNIDSNGYVTALLPANTNKNCPAIGFIAHTDTAPDYSGYMIKPKITENYNGLDIPLKNGITISPSEFGFLNRLKGKTIITADGTTLLGADDKAGVSEIICAMEYIINNAEIKHGDIKAAFTPDEEIGRGVDFFDVKGFGCDFAYTIDGGDLGELSCESFNAAYANIDINGKNVHPGYAKNIMKNAALIGAELVSVLPKNEIPSKTEGYEGFYHLCEFNADVSHAHLEFIIRDFDKNNFIKRKENIACIVNALNKKYGKDTVTADIGDSYYNMKEALENCPEAVNAAVKAMKMADVEPNIIPIRGGTDGCRLSFEGLPCPNLFTGGFNFHGPYELCVVEYMEKAAETIVNLCRIFGGDRD